MNKFLTLMAILGIVCSSVFAEEAPASKPKAEKFTVTKVLASRTDHSSLESAKTEADKITNDENLMAELENNFYMLCWHYKNNKPIIVTEKTETRQYNARRILEEYYEQLGNIKKSYSYDEQEMVEDSMAARYSKLRKGARGKIADIEVALKPPFTSDIDGVKRSRGEQVDFNGWCTTYDLQVKIQANFDFIMAAIGKIRVMAESNATFINDNFLIREGEVVRVYYKVKDGKIVPIMVGYGESMLSYQYAPIKNPTMAQNGDIWKVCFDKIGKRDCTSQKGIECTVGVRPSINKDAHGTYFLATVTHAPEPEIEDSEAAKANPMAAGHEAMKAAKANTVNIQANSASLKAVETQATENSRHIDHVNLKVEDAHSRLDGATGGSVSVISVNTRIGRKPRSEGTCQINVPSRSVE